MHSLSSNNDVRVLIDPILPLPFILDPLNDFSEHFPWPYSDNRIAHKLHDVPPVLVYGFGHNVDESGRLLPQALIKYLFTLEIPLCEEGCAAAALGLPQVLNQGVSIIEVFNLCHEDRGLQGLTVGQQGTLVWRLIRQVVQNCYWDKFQDLADVL